MANREPLTAEQIVAAAVKLFKEVCFIVRSERDK